MAELPSDIRERLANIEDPKLRDAVERAATAGLNPDRLRDAEEHARFAEERARAERQDYLTKISDAALAGDFGADCKMAATRALAGGRTWETLERVSRIVVEAKRRNAAVRK